MTERTDVQKLADAAKGTNGTVAAHARRQAGLGDDHPLNDMIGAYEGPVWDRILKNIKRNREADERDALTERV